MKFVNIALAFILFRSLTVSALDDEDCKNWKRFESETEVKYLKVIMNAKYWELAKVHCQDLGGQLLIIRDDSTADFIIANVVVTKYFYYWFGLFILDGKKYWVDGTTPDDNDYQNWDAGTKIEKDNCASSMWRNKADRWRLELCKSSRNFICEAEIPCNQVPSFSVGEGALGMWNGSMWNTTIIMKQRLHVNCFAKGYVGNVVKAQLTCPWKNISVVDAKVNVSALINFDEDSHMETCECTTFEKGDKKKAATLTFTYKTSPQFVNASDVNNRIFTILIGHGFNRSFDIIAHPYPDFFELSVNGTRVDRARYKMRIEVLDEKLHFRVTISLPNLSLNESGAYVFAVDNYVKNALKSRFTLHVVKEKKGPPPNDKYTRGSNTLFYLLVFGLAFLAILLIVAWGARKGMKRDTMVPDASEDVQQEDEAPIPEMENVNLEDNGDEEEIKDMAASVISGENIEVEGSYISESIL